MARKSKRTARSTGLAWGEGQLREFVRQDGSIRVQAAWWETQPGGKRRLRRQSFSHADADVARDEAEDFLRQRRRDRRDGRYLAPTDMTVEDVVLAHIERGKGRWKESTYATYRQRAFSRIIPFLGSVRVVELTTARIQYWIDMCAREGSHAKTLEESVRLLSGALKSAARLGIVRHNEAQGVEVPTAEPTPHRTWTNAHIAQVLATAATEPMEHALYRVALFTGARPGELRALMWDDIDVDRGVLHIRRTITRDANNHEIVGTTTKTKRNRAVALPPTVLAALKTWKVEQARRQLAAPAWDPGHFVFTGKRGQFLGATTWQRYQERLAKRAGVPYVGLHELRHTNATVELAAGTHPKIVSDRLGHKKIETTLNLYSHVSADLQRAAADALEARIEAATATTQEPKTGD